MTIVRYEQDFYAWALQNSQALRVGKIAEADLEHIAEELESMGASERRELFSRLKVLVLHLLKHQCQPERRGKSWLLTIDHQRDILEQLLGQSPSLKTVVTPETLQETYRKAVKTAVLETGLDEDIFPPSCPYTLAQLLDETYLPE